MLAKTEMSGKRGNPGRSYAERLLGRVEFAFVVGVLGQRPIARLDTEYARNPDSSKRSSEDRIHVFEHARDRGKPLPTDVINRLAKEPELALVSHIAKSMFWPLLLDPPQTRTVATKMVRRCLDQLNLIRLPVGLEEAWLSKKWKREAADKEWQEEAGLVRSTIENLISEHPQNLNVVALLGALYREACLTFEPEAAGYLGTRFWMLLEDFFGTPQFDSISAELCDFSVNRIVYDRDEGEARRPFSELGSDRMPGKGVGLLLPGDDRDALELLGSVNAYGGGAAAAGKK